MTSNTATNTEQANPTLIRLPPAKWLQVLKEFQAAETLKRETAAAAAAADNAHKALKGNILRALGNARGAVCGNLIVAVEESSDSATTITFTNGQKFELAKVSSVVVGNVSYLGKDIASVYGGRKGGVSVKVTG
jgi:hypothetical protein